MRTNHGRLSASPTDLANFLACRHRTALDWLVAHRRLEKPHFSDPLADILRTRGQEHERRYVAALAARGLTVVDLGPVERDSRAVRTIDAMRAGADVIVQAVLSDDHWLGYADVLIKVDAPSPAFGPWSYEVQDTKLSRETRGGTILQLALYSELVGQIQGRRPERFHVVTPIASEPYRLDDFAAFYRQVKGRFLEFVTENGSGEPPSVYPEPADHCAVCQWAARCNARRRHDDHLSFVAGLGRSHQAELVSRGVSTLAQLAALPVPLPFAPSRGSRDTFERLREQARLQEAQRRSGQLMFEVLPVRESFGLTQLPEPRPGDLFLDLEGDPFGRPVVSAQAGEGGREYLFGLSRLEADGAFSYTPRWAFSDAEERAAFEAVIADILEALAQDPLIHVYHYAPYEPATFKLLMGRYASSETELDRLLRGRRFVDLYAIARNAVRAGVESYSIKSLEPYYRFRRDIELETAGDERRVIEVALETGDFSPVTASVRDAVAGYNRDDCRSTAELRRWLEDLRAHQIAAGVEIARPSIPSDEPTEQVKERQRKIHVLREQLLNDVPGHPQERDLEQQARYVLAYLLDWHYREDKVSWWEYFQLIGLSDEELLDEPSAIVGLEFVGREGPFIGGKSGRPTGSMRDRYRYPPQECEIRVGQALKTRSEQTFGEVLVIDRANRTLTIKRGKTALDLSPSVVFSHEHVSVERPAAALFRIGERVASGGFANAPRAAADLLLRRTAPVASTAERDDDSIADRAVRMVTSLHGGTVAIQGPPGAGKTHTGARMICALVRAGRRVGVTATGHKVIRNLLQAVAAEAAAQQLTLRMGHKPSEVGEYGDDGIRDFADNGPALDAVRNGAVQVLGGTAWMWARDEFASAVDVLFIDEAGQMSLANALAVSGAASNLVLLGDPQQLEQPQKGSHPDGVGISALDYILDGHQTMPADRGLFLPVTWRLAPSICAFTSEVFYESKLQPHRGLERQRLLGSTVCDGAGLVLVEVEHAGCQNASDDEVQVVAELVQALLQPGVQRIDASDQPHALTPDDIKVVAPYNAHVRRLQERLPGVRVGTVDKFQGQEAPVVIYSMATSHPDDAPRGMEFLYSLNRLNVATSRARCASIVVASPRLFEPECRTPRQMLLANALARYREMAHVIKWPRPVRP
jgi:predicted RecB family nuclease